MKKEIVPILSAITILMFLAKPAFAACTVNGESIPCDIFWSQFGWIFMTMGAISLAGFIFWIIMLVDCLRRDFKDKTIWILLMIFLSFLGSILYFFMVKKASPKLK